MKNIFEIAKEFGLEVPEDKKKDFEKAVLENYKTVADYEKQTDKVTNLTDQLKTATDALKEFEGVDPKDLQGQIATLTQQLSNKEKEYQDQIADRDFQDLLKTAIADAKGKNAKAITALLDVDTLKASKNQSNDVAAALKALSEAEDSKMLFGDPEPEVIGGGNPIGTVKKGTGGDTPTDQMRSIMGLPPVNAK